VTKSKIKKMSEELTLENDGESKAATGAETADLIRKCEKLLSLEGINGLTGIEALTVQDILQNVQDTMGEQRRIINDLYEQRERETALRGETWEVLP
jgi:hypothetical protein